MKKFCYLVLVFALALSFTVPAAAEAGLYHITDAAGILTEEEWDLLESRAEELDSSCGIFVVIVEDSADYGRSIEEACDYFFDAYDLGPDAIVMVLSMTDRTFWIDDYGSYGSLVLTDSGRRSLENAMLDDFSRDDWYDGLMDYLDQSQVLLDAGEVGNYVGSDDVTGYGETSTGHRVLTAYGIALVVGVIAAFITCSIFKRQMKTAVKATSAEQYVAPSGVQMRIREDHYTHTTRTKRKIERDTNSKSRSGHNSGGGGRF